MAKMDECIQAKAAAPEDPYTARKKKEAAMKYTLITAATLTPATKKPPINSDEEKDAKAIMW